MRRWREGPRSCAPTSRELVPAVVTVHNCRPLLVSTPERGALAVPLSLCPRGDITWALAQGESLEDRFVGGDVVQPDPGDPAQGFAVEQVAYERLTASRGTCSSAELSTPRPPATKPEAARGARPEPFGTGASL